MPVQVACRLRDFCAERRLSFTDAPYKSVLSDLDPTTEKSSVITKKRPLTASWSNGRTTLFKT